MKHVIVNPYSQEHEWCKDYFPDRSLGMMPVAGRCAAEYFIDLALRCEAEKLLLRINRLLPGDSGAVRMLGKIYFLKGDLAGAVNICRKLAGTDPDDPVVLNNLGTALIASGFYESGIRRLLEAERLSKGARYIQLNLVFAYIAAGRFALAEKYWTAAQRSSDDPLISLLPADAIVSFPAGHR